VKTKLLFLSLLSIISINSHAAYFYEKVNKGLPFKLVSLINHKLTDHSIWQKIKNRILPSSLNTQKRINEQLIALQKEKAAPLSEKAKCTESFDIASDISCKICKPEKDRYGIQTKVRKNKVRSELGASIIQADCKYLILIDSAVNNASLNIDCSSDRNQKKNQCTAWTHIPNYDAFIKELREKATNQTKTKRGCSAKPGC
jgi:hypothetical protein